ncbi:MAG: 4-alpha-glucanotransferase [Terracidiphilus sp.]
MKFPRCSGILLYFTSLPGRFGIGDFGPFAYEFADSLFAAGQKLWQVLPLNPTGYGDSPYQCFPAFAGSPIFFSLERLRDQGLLQSSDLDLAQAPPFPEDFVDYGPVIEFKRSALRRAAQVFFADGSRADRAAFDRFCESASPWLDDYALFMALKDAHHGTAWTWWDAQIRQRNPRAVNEWSQKLAPELKAFKYWQFEFFRQWEHLKTYCQQLGIRFIGDIPIYVAHDSADVRAH